MKKKHRWLVIGGGSIGRRHARNLRSLGENDLLLMEPGEKARKALATELKIPAFASLQEGLKQNPTVVLICSPTRFHLEQAELCLNQGCSLFIEKPIASDWKGVSKFVEKAEASGVPILVGCNFRFHPGLQLLRKLIDEKKLGKLVSLQANFGYHLPFWHPYEDYRKGYSANKKLGGGVALDRIHEFDLLRWLGGNIRSITGRCRNTRSLEIDTEDIVQSEMAFTSGAWGSLQIDYLRRKYRCTIEVLGTEGHATWDYTKASLTWWPSGGAREISRSWPKWEANDMYLDQTKHFLRVLAGKEKPQQDAKDAAEILRRVLEVKRGKTK